MFSYESPHRSRTDARRPRGRHRAAEAPVGAPAPTTSADGTARPPARPPVELIGTPRGNWLTRGRDGRLTAYATGPKGLLRWTEGTPWEPAWSGPRHFPVPGLTDASIAQGPLGHVHVAGRRTPGSDPESVDVVHAVQYQTGRPFTRWRSLGAVSRRALRPRLGVPLVGVDATGAAHVFLRNGGGGVSTRRDSPRDGWLPWQDLGGRDVQARLASWSTGRGGVGVLAPAADGALCWAQGADDAHVTREDPVDGIAAPAEVTALCSVTGGPVCLWSAPDRDGVLLRTDTGRVVELGGAPDGGPVAALWLPGDGERLALACRGRDGTLLVGVCDTAVSETAGGGPAAAWAAYDVGPFVGAPALARADGGRVALAVVAPTGPLLAREFAEEFPGRLEFTAI
ncbi:hypothetical protein [Streptomyces sp. NPDC050504]|uniref:hypothetical protein n=1 Tax=Streptomyces sp. NPDC050504 TaxID=3365618 RepID=UPI0037AC190C